MEKRHFEEIARILKKHKGDGDYLNEVMNRLANELARYFKKEFENFNGDKFFQILSKYPKK